MTDPRPHLRALAEAYPAGSAVSVPREWLLAVLDGDACESDAARADRLLTVEEAAERLRMSPQWVYRNAKKLPFTRRPGRKALRFSEIGLERYLQARRAS